MKRSVKPKLATRKMIWKIRSSIPQASPSVAGFPKRKPSDSATGLPRHVFPNRARKNGGWAGGHIVEEVDHGS